MLVTPLQTKGLCAQRNAPLKVRRGVISSIGLEIMKSDLRVATVEEMQELGFENPRLVASGTSTTGGK